MDANGLTLGLNGREPSGAQGDGGPVVTFQPEAGPDETVNDLESQGVEIPAGISEHPWSRVATESLRERGSGLQVPYYALPIRTPEANTSAPPSTTWTADMTKLMRKYR